VKKWFGKGLPRTETTLKGGKGGLTFLVCKSPPSQQSLKSHTEKKTPRWFVFFVCVIPKMKQKTPLENQKKSKMEGLLTPGGLIPKNPQQGKGKSKEHPGGVKPQNVVETKRKEPRFWLGVFRFAGLNGWKKGSRTSPTS